MACPQRSFATAAFLLLLAAAFLVAQRDAFDGGFYREVPLADRALASGASDPAWSPDGRTIAFSLFGSIWRMHAGGGPARQLTASPGYDAGPAWSPDGRTIAFIRGTAPIRGVQLGTVGKLVLMDVESLAERLPAADLTIAGTPSWSPDNAWLFVSQALPAETALFAVSAQGQPPKRITGALASRVPSIVPRGSGWFYYWYPSAPHPDGRSLAFSGDRDNTPQLWQVPLRDGLVVTRKLTNYRESEQADIQDLTWSGPDTLLYSANLHSGRTNFDLWEWTQAGGARRRTDTLQDEFSPRISPDGRTVLFVSNYLGNLDLFTADTALARAHRVPVGELQFRSPQGRLRVTLAQPGRISVRASDGKYYAPRGALWRMHPGMGEAAGFFHARTSFELDLPAGPVRLAAFRGIEHEPVELLTGIEPGRTNEAKLAFRRVLHWQGNGWWTGENHIHANYAGPYYLRPDDALTMVEAEDLNVANMLAANAEGTRIYDREFFTGKPDAVSTASHLLYWNAEYRNRIVYGHMALLNLTRLREPIYTSFEGTPYPWDYPSNTMAARDARRQGAVVDWVHPILGGTRDPFDFTVSAKELPVTAALGQVDVIDIYPWGPLAAEVWYLLLNCGFRIAPGAGTDTFSNWRSINQLPGASRVYVRSARPLAYPDWIAGLRQGRSFATNGPLVELEAGGAWPGDTLRATAWTARIRAESPSPIRSIEVIRNGRVVHTEPGFGRKQLEFRWPADRAEPGWLAVRVRADAEPRALGQPLEAHTAPIYLEPAGRTMTPDPQSAATLRDWVDRLWNLIVMRDRFEKPEHRRQVRDLVMQARDFYHRHAR